MDKIDGVSDTDYNGHFGANIFFTLDMEYDEVTTLGEVKKIIKKWIE